MTVEIENNGRPVKPIDWEKVDRLLEAGCLGTEIAAHFNMHPDTFYIRCQKEKGMGYTAYSQEKKQKGDSILRAAQYKTALDGNTTMQVWLGKQRLGQRDKPKEEEAQDEFARMLVKYISDLQKIPGTPKFSQSPMEDEQPLLDQG